MVSGDLGQRPGFEWKHGKAPQRDNVLGGWWVYSRRILRMASGHVCTGDGGWRFYKDGSAIHAGR